MIVTASWFILQACAEAWLMLIWDKTCQMSSFISLSFIADWTQRQNCNCSVEKNKKRIKMFMDYCQTQDGCGKEMISKCSLRPMNNPIRPKYLFRSAQSTIRKRIQNVKTIIVDDSLCACTHAWTWWPETCLHSLSFISAANKPDDGSNWLAVKATSDQVIIWHMIAIES